MVGIGAPATARRYFDQATSVFETDPATALRILREATDTDPSMADAWLCRIAAGDDNLSTLEALYRHGSRLHRESNRLGVQLAAAIKAGPYLSITVTEASHAGIALAGALVDDKEFDRAEAILDNSALLDSWENHQWRQHIRAYLMFATGRWPDVLAEVGRALPPQAIVMSALTAGNCALAAHAAAHLGQARVALDWSNRVDLRADTGRSNTAAVAISPVDFPLIAADLAYLRGMVHRQLGQEQEAGIWLSKAVLNGVLIDAAKQALADPQMQLIVTDEAAIASRTNRWDGATESPADVRADEANRERRAELLAEGRVLLNNQVGLVEVKRAVAELEDQMEVRALRLAHGLPVTNQTNHVL